MVLQLYRDPKSPATLLVIAVLDAMKVEYEPKKVHSELLKTGKSRWFLDTNYVKEFHPFAELPAMEDDGFILFESRAIALYITTKYADQGEDLLPGKDLKSQMLFAQAVSVELSKFDPLARGITHETLIKPIHGLVTDEARLQLLTETLSTNLKAYDRILSKQKFMAGDKLTLADLYHLPHGQMLLALGKANELKTLPNVSRWWNKISELPYWKATWEKFGADSTMAGLALATMSKA